MNLQAHPELLDRLAAHHALGTLRGSARRRLESMAREQPAVRAAVLTWQGRLSSLAELQPAQAPDAAVWTRIQNLVEADQQQQAMQAARSEATAGFPPRGWLQSLLLWRGVAAVGIAAAVFAMVGGVQLRDRLGGEIASLQTRLQATPQIQYVAVLVNAQPSSASSASAAGAMDTASMLVTFDAKSNQLVLQRVGGYQETPDKSLQLWALPPTGAPRSLGVLGSDRVLHLPATPGEVREVPALAISLEPLGGVPSAGGPTGPVLFKGALIQKTS